MRAMSCSLLGSRCRLTAILRSVFVAAAFALIGPSDNRALAYSPSASVTAAHNIPHLSIYLSALSNTFGISTSTLTSSNTYVLSVLILPGIFLALCILSLFIFALVMFSRCCCKCGKNSPDVKKMNGKTDEEYAEWAKIVTCRKVTLIVFFSFFLITAFSGTQMGWYGSSKYNRGINNLHANIGALGGVFSGIQSLGASFSSTGNALQLQIDESTCSTTHSSSTAAITGYVKTFISTGATIVSDTSSVSKGITSLSGYLTKYAVHDKSTTFYVIYSVVSGYCLLIALGAGLRNKVMSQVMFFFTYWLVLLLAICAAIGGIVVMVLSDFCVSPTGNLVASLPAGTIGNYTTYYTSCTGNNPLGNSFSTAFTSTAALNQSISALLAHGCQGDVHMQNALKIVPYMNMNISTTQDYVNCSSIKIILDSTFNDSICTDLFAGCWVYFLCLHLVGFSLFVVLCSISTLWEYFDPFYWTLNPVREEHVADEEEGDVMKEETERDGWEDEKEFESDVIPVKSPVKIIRRPSIFELLVANENENRRALKEIELAENAKKKSRFSMIMTATVGTEASAPPTPSVENDQIGASF